MSEIYRADATLVLNDIEHALNRIEKLLKKIEGHLAYYVEAGQAMNVKVVDKD